MRAAGEDLCGKLVSAGGGGHAGPLLHHPGGGTAGGGHGAHSLHPLADSFAESQIGAVMKWGQFQSEAALALFERISAFYAGLPPFSLE